MNRNLTELAELRLHESAAWRNLHRECFDEIFAGGPGLCLTEALGRYVAWCQRRQVWASFSELRRQLAKAGYQVDGDTICGVQLNEAEIAFQQDGDELNVLRATQLLGVEAGVLRSLREFGGGPTFCENRGRILYPRAGLLQWKQKLLRRQRETGWGKGWERDFWRCLEELCRFRVIEWQHMDSEGRLDSAIHPRLLSRKADRVTEVDLFTAVRAWYLETIGLAPWALRSVIQVFLPMAPLECQLVRARSGRKRYYEWRGVWLRSAETAEEAHVAARLRVKSGLQIDVPSICALVDAKADRVGPVLK